MAFCPSDKSFTCFSVLLKAAKKPKVSAFFSNVISVVKAALYKRYAVSA